MKTTKFKESIEVLVVVDDDDNTYKYILKDLQARYNDISLRMFSRKRSIWMHRDYINWVYPVSKGKFILVLNDDAEFVNPDWDEHTFCRLELCLANKPDGIIYGFTDTMSNDPWLCMFPLLSRKAVDILGFILPNQRQNWLADWDIASIFDHLLVRRKVPLPEAKIRHLSHHMGLRDKDDINKSIEKTFKNNTPVDLPIVAWAETLAKEIGKTAILHGTHKLSSPAISCVISANNLSKVNRTIKNITEQSEKDLEIIVMNNGILDNVEIDDKRVKVIKMKKPSWSTAKQFNESIQRKLFKGQFVMHLKEGQTIDKFDLSMITDFAKANPHVYAMYLRNTAEDEKIGTCITDKLIEEPSIFCYNKLMLDWMTTVRLSDTFFVATRFLFDPKDPDYYLGFLNAIGHLIPIYPI